MAKYYIERKCQIIGKEECERINRGLETWCDCRTDLCNGEPGWTTKTFKGLEKSGPKPGSADSEDSSSSAGSGGTNSSGTAGAASDGAMMMMATIVVLLISAIIAQLLI